MNLPKCILHILKERVSSKRLPESVQWRDLKTCLKITDFLTHSKMFSVFTKDMFLLKFRKISIRCWVLESFRKLFLNQYYDAVSKILSVSHQSNLRPCPPTSPTPHSALWRRQFPKYQNRFDKSIIVLFYVSIYNSNLYVYLNNVKVHICQVLCGAKVKILLISHFCPLFSQMLLEH